MKFRIWIFILMSFCGFVFATESSKNTHSALPILLYLPLMDDDLGSSVMAQNQLTVTPSTTYNNITQIRVTIFNSGSGCTGGSTTCNITDPGVVALVGGHSYRTTEASNSALKAACPSFDTSKDLVYRLRSSIGTLGSASACISGGTCTDSTNCGWFASKTWTP